jgi:FemAB-related protein (PEP-CTERM system-associated)
VTLRIEPFTGLAAEWDEFVRGSAGWTHFHTWGWKGVIERVMGHECLYLAACDADGRLAGVLPLVRVRSTLFGHYLISMPFLNYGGPLGSDNAITSLVGHAAKVAERDRVKLLELRTRSGLPVTLPASHRKITVMLDLPQGNPGALWNAFQPKVRSQVRRPQKEGVSVRFGPDQCEPFFQVFSHHMRDLGTPTQPKRFFEALLDTFAHDVWFGCAYYNGQAIAGGCGFSWSGEFEMTWASALTAYKPMAPNMVLYWAFMERAIEQGLTLFNFGRCTPGSGTHRFKRQWGSRDVPLWWYHVAAGARTATPSPQEGLYALGARLWRHLPLALATAWGPRIVRYIP